MLKMFEKDERNIAQSSKAFVQEAREKVAILNQKLQRLLDSYLDQIIEKEIYQQKKRELMSEKKTLDEKILTLEQKRVGWVEPMREWIKEAQTGPKIAGDNDLFQKKVIAKKLFGSNLQLAGRKITLKSVADEGENAWAALRAASKRIGKNRDCFTIVGRARFELAKA